MCIGTLAARLHTVVTHINLLQIGWISSTPVASSIPLDSLLTKSLLDN